MTCPGGNRVWGTQGGCDMITRLFKSNHGTAEPYPERGDSLSNMIVLHGFPRDSSRGPRSPSPGLLHPFSYHCITWPIGGPFTVAHIAQSQSQHSGTKPWPRLTVCHGIPASVPISMPPPLIYPRPPTKLQYFINFTGLYGNYTEFFKNRIKIP